MIYARFDRPWSKLNSTVCMLRDVEVQGSRGKPRKSNLRQGLITCEKFNCRKSNLRQSQKITRMKFRNSHPTTWCLFQLLTDIYVLIDIEYSPKARRCTYSILDRTNAMHLLSLGRTLNKFYSRSWLIDYGFGSIWLGTFLGPTRWGSLATCNASPVTWILSKVVEGRLAFGLATTDEDSTKIETQLYVFVFQYGCCLWSTKTKFAV